MENVILTKTFDFAKRIVKLKVYLNIEHKEYTLSEQVLRSGTSIGANVTESQNARSRNEFVSKICIAQGEANETMYWLRLLHETDYLDDKEYVSLFNDCEEIYKILSSIIINTKAD